jgi:hypothetical protein
VGDFELGMRNEVRMPNGNAAPGHMMYVHRPSIEKLGPELRAFIERSI